MDAIELKSETHDALTELKDWLQQVLDGFDTEDELPLEMPDGTPVSSLQDVAVMAEKSLLGAAFLVLNHKEAASPELVNEAEGEVVKLAAAPDDDYSGSLCLMIAIPKETSENWVGLGVDKEDLHITVLYFGDYNEFDMNAETFFSYARQVARRWEPFEVSLNGLSRFSMDPMDAVVVNADAPELENLRGDAVESANFLNVTIEQTHGYTPHMTLGYLDKDKDLPVQRWEPQVFLAEHLVAAYGDQKVSIMLGSGNDVKDVFRGEGVGGVPNGANTSTRTRRSGRARVLAGRPRRKRVRYLKD